MEFDENLNPINQSEGADWNQPEPNVPANQPEPSQNSFAQPINPNIEPSKIVEPTPTPPPSVESPTPPAPAPEPDSLPKKNISTNNTTIGLIIASTLLAAVAITAICANYNQQPVNIPSTSIANQGLRVTGIGEAYATPDVAKIMFGVRTEAKNIADAQKNNSDIIANVKNELAKFNIEAKDIKTTNYNISPDYDYRIVRRPILRGYYTQHSLEITVRKLEDADAIVQMLGKTGITEISQVRFTIDDITETQNEAREQAIAKAKDKASSIASLSGAKLGKIISIEENFGQPGWPRPVFEMVDGFGAGETEPKIGLEEGATLITSTIVITYSLN